MKLTKYFIPAALGLLLTFSSCDDYEDVPVEQFSLEYVFSATDSLGTNAKKYLNGIYQMIPNGHNRLGKNGILDDGDYLASASDDAITSSLNQNYTYKLATGQYSAASTISQDMYWSNLYEGIRKVNTFVEHIDVVPLKETFNDGIPLNRAWKAEARFLRAYFYFELVKRYGGVPIVNKIYELKDNVELPRNTFEECIDFIVTELDGIKDSLRTHPIANPASDAHVVTQGAAMALKTRVLLYAASPLFNKEPIEANNPLVGYTSYKEERWKKAADAAKSFIDTYGPEGQNVYSLCTRRYPLIFITYYQNYFQEVIFFQQGDQGTDVEQANGPVGFSGSNLARGRTSPTQNLVDAFPMKDGKPIGKSTKYEYNPETMYENRDPRLDFNILHNGSLWLRNTLETYEGGTNNPSSSIQKTKTSYYLRKFLGDYDQTNSSTSYAAANHFWILFRYAEILLNYAEALNEYAGPDDVYPILKELRARAGIDEGTDKMYGLEAGMSKDQMREIIRNERRIELAFEEHRYWDIRRWKLAEKIYEEPLKGLSIVKNGDRLVPTEINVQTWKDGKGKFQEHMYLYPISYSECIKNRNMKQNPGW
ncbi:MAG: RagB/SusD family nutrient uptake outer membrane protein [Candidatus Azobacteroides sp.]|nr:RagB/SusD family nutrient uptake outer membrane protein [Candidatus Azobacteroides sp.]